MYQAGLITSNVDTAPLRKLGEFVFTSDSTNGPRGFVYVQAATSTALTVGQVVGISAAGVATPLTTTNSAPGQSVGRRVGVVVTAVSSSASAQYVWVQVWGAGTVLTAAAAAIYTQLNTTATAGAVDDDATASSEVVDGLSLTTAAGSATTTAAFLNFPYVGRTL